VDEDPDNLSHNARRYSEVSFLWSMIVLSSIVWCLRSTFSASNWQRKLRY
jgi:hypothetical protein